MTKAQRVSEAESEAAMEVYAPPKAAPLAKADALPPFETIIERLGGMSPEAVEKLLAVYRELKADKAEQAYNIAFAAFQAECPTISRTQTAKIVSNKGAGFSYNYADIETIMRTVRPVLVKYGLSVSFDSEEFDEKTRTLTATCRCSHVGGHSAVTSFPVPTESSAGMSPQQKHGAASTYAKRRALSDRLGIWTGDPDHDGGDPPAPSPLLTEEQRQQITDLVGEVNQNWDDLLRWWGVPNFSDARQDKYKAAVTFLELKKQKMKGKT